MKSQFKFVELNPKALGRRGDRILCVLPFYTMVDIVVLLQILLYNVVKKKGVEAMKLVLKILALPVLFVVKLICVLGNLLTNVVSYVIGILLLVIGGSAIYCIVKALWQSLLILVVLGIATIAAVFLLVWAVMKAENIGESLGAFIRS